MLGPFQILIIRSFCQLHFSHKEAESKFLSTQDISSRSLYTIFLKRKLDVCMELTLPFQISFYVNTSKLEFILFLNPFFLGTHVFAFECQVHLPVIVINLGLYEFFYILWFPISRSIIFNYVWKSTVKIVEERLSTLHCRSIFSLKIFFLQTQSTKL